MRHPSVIRTELLAGVAQMLERLRIRIGMYASDELDVLRKLEQPQQYDLTVGLTNHLMGEFGHLTQPKEPRFDKTRRALAKKRGRPPRGLKAAGEPVPSDAAPEAPHA
jgi:hypothetical protein